MEQYRLNTLRLTGRHYGCLIHGLSDGSDPWKLNKIAFSSTTDFVFIASVRNIRGYLLHRGRNYELGHLNDSYDEFSQIPVSCQNNCALSALLSGTPDVILNCDYLGDEINSIKCGATYSDQRGDMERLVAVTDDGKVYIWQIEKRHIKNAVERRTPITFKKPLVYDNEISTWSIAVSPTDKVEYRSILAVGANNYQITLIDLETGKIVRKLIGHHHNIPSLAFSPCGKYLMSGSVDETCIIWEVETGRIMKRMTLSVGQWGWGTEFLETKDIEPAMKEHTGVVNGFKDRRIFTGHEGAEQDSPEASYQDLLLSDHYEEYDNALDPIAEMNQELSDELALDYLEEGEENWETMRDMMDEAIMQQLRPGGPSVFVFEPHLTTPAGHVDRRQSVSTASWVSDPPRGPHRWETESEQEQVFIRVLNRHAMNFEAPRTPPHAVYEVGYPTGKLLSVCTTQADLLLFDVSTGSSLLTISGLLKKANPAWPQDWNVSIRERFVFTQWIPEYSCLLVGNQTSNLVLLHFTRVLPTSTEDDADLLRISVLGFPCFGIENASLKGLAVRKIERNPGTLYFEILFADVTGAVRIFKLERSRALEPSLDLFKL